MVAHDAKLGLYIDIWRDVIGYGVTPEEAKRNAEWAMREIREKAERQKPKSPVMRYSLLTGKIQTR